MPSSSSVKKPLALHHLELVRVTLANTKCSWHAELS